MTATPQRIFVVEDEVLVAFDMTEVLEDLGFEVVGPSVRLEDAEMKARDSDIDAAFLDVNLGAGKTSKSVVEILKARGIPYVFITAYDREQISFVDENDQVVKKPVNGDKMLETLRRIYPGLET